MIDVQTEHVLVVPTRVFHELGYFQGFSGQTERYLPELLSPRHTSYRARAEMERDASFKQLIPYCVFQHRDAQGRLHVFEYTRGKGQGEARLHSKRSVGIGGHISSDDAALATADPYAEGLRRELAEEVEIASPYRQRCVGLINDDETDVGRVHLGVVHVFELDRPDVAPREHEILASGFRPVEELLADLAGFESWSRICLEAIYGRG